MLLQTKNFVAHLFAHRSCGRDPQQPASLAEIGQFQDEAIYVDYLARGQRDCAAVIAPGQTPGARC
jgi:hypothetical protein